MFKPQIDNNFDGKLFNSDYFHHKGSECVYCALQFRHLHKVGTKLKEFIMVKKHVKTWDDEFTDRFCDTNIVGVLCWKFKNGEDVPSPKAVIDFIKQKFS